MFTGIIEEIGTVRFIRKGRVSASVEIGCKEILEDVKIGDSIAVNGVCLTVTALTGSGFTADVMHETLRRSSLGTLTAGSRVNLERAMAAGGRFGGHIVSGHIDGTGTVDKLTRDENAVWYTIGCGDSLLRYIIEKGSIAIDGISLTAAEVHKGGFSVSIIPHTLSQTTLADRKPGDLVNLENDCIGKYVERLLTFDRGAAGKEPGISSCTGMATLAGKPSRTGIPSRSPQSPAKPSSLTREFLIENGF